MNAENTCRTCLKSGEETRPIYTAITVSGDEVHLSDILLNSYDYKVDPNDGLPQQICNDCTYQLTITHAFKNLIENSFKTLSQNVNVLYACKEAESTLDSDTDNKINIRNSSNADTTKTLDTNAATVKTDTKFFCTECKEQFLSTYALYQHCKHKHPLKTEEGRECDLCREKFPDFKSLIIHRKLHLTPYTCENCWEGFQTSEDLNFHSCTSLSDDKDKETEKDYRQCDQCGKSYPKGYFKYHMLIHSEKRAYSCSYCPKKFKVRCSLNSHILWKHKRTRNHKCSICNSTFISASSKSTHIRKHHLNEKKHSCESCGKCFFSKSEIERHMLSHTGVKNFHCHACDKSYQTRYGLNVHLRVHNQNSVTYQFKELDFER